MSVFVQGSDQEKIHHKALECQSLSVWQLIFYLPGHIFFFICSFFKVIKMTSKCLKLKWNGEWFFGKVLSIFNVISLKCRSLSSEKWLRVYLFFVCLFIFFLQCRGESHSRDRRQKREEPSVYTLCTVIGKSSRPIGEQKSLGYCKSLDCVAGVLRGIRLIYQQEENVSWRQESARKGLNTTSGAQFAALPLVKSVVWFARPVVNWRSCSVSKSTY